MYKTSKLHCISLKKCRRSLSYRIRIRILIYSLEKGIRILKRNRLRSFAGLWSRVEMIRFQIRIRPSRAKKNVYPTVKKPDWQPPKKTRSGSDHLKISDQDSSLKTTKLDPTQKLGS